MKYRKVRGFKDGKREGGRTRPSERLRTEVTDMEFRIAGSIKPKGIDEEDVSVGDNRDLYVRASNLRNDCVEIQFDNGPRVHVDANALKQLIERCS